MKIVTRKPPKHSDREKPSRESSASRMKREWVRSRNRARKVRLVPERHLIVSEGKRTEPLYFGEIKRRINEIYHGERVMVEIRGAGTDTLSLFEYARRCVEGSVMGYSHVWVVYDKDDFPDDRFDAVVSCCKNASNDVVSYHPVWSNEAFELWYILHFEYLQADIPRRDYESKITDHPSRLGLGKYFKNRDDMFGCLEPYLQDAISSAERLEIENRGKKPSQSRPGTTVHHVLKHLLPYMNAFWE